MTIVDSDRLTFSPTDGVPAPVAPYSHAVRVGPLLFLTGQLPLDPETGDVVGVDVGTQTKAVMANLERVLDLCGAALDDVVQVRAYLTSMDLYDDFNGAYASYFGGGLPARTCVAVVGLARGALVEIDAIAVHQPSPPRVAFGRRYPPTRRC
jgi:2-iminobutanoate/2-iminopropanoate deaminase